MTLAVTRSAQPLVSASFCSLPAAGDMPLGLYAVGGSVRLVSRRSTS